MGISKVDAAAAHQVYLQTFENNAQHIYAYSDGSLGGKEGETRAGSGFVVYHLGDIVTRQARGLGRHTGVYDAELHGISSATFACIKTALERPFGLDIRHIHVFADNSAAVDHTYSPLALPGQRWTKIARFNTKAFLDGDPA